MDMSFSQIASAVATTPEQRARGIENERLAEEWLARKQTSNRILAALDTSLQETGTLHASRLGRRGRLRDATGRHLYRPEWNESETINTLAHQRAAVERAAYHLQRLYEAV